MLCCRNGVLQVSLQSVMCCVVVMGYCKCLCSQSCVVLLSWGIASVSAVSHVLCCCNGVLQVSMQLVMCCVVVMGCCNVSVVCHVLCCCNGVMKVSL